ncbi:hypothetical protein Tco_0073405 [Tanacetum coccineum]
MRYQSARLLEMEECPDSGMKNERQDAYSEAKKHQKDRLECILHSKGNYKISNLKGMSYDEIRPIFEKRRRRTQRIFGDIIPREEVLMEVESLSTNFPIVDWKTCVLTENFMYYQVFRGDGSSKNYKVLSEMLEDFDRQDVEELYRLVKKKYSASRLEGFDLMLWGDLYTLFESDEEDEIWKN